VVYNVCLYFLEPNKEAFGKYWQGGNHMKLLFWSLIGGIAGTALMDIAGIYSEKVKFTSGGE
jgi:hypothetical protein